MKLGSSTTKSKVDEVIDRDGVDIFFFTLLLLDCAIIGPPGDVAPPGIQSRQLFCELLYT